MQPKTASEWHDFPRTALRLRGEVRAGSVGQRERPEDGAEPNSNRKRLRTTQQLHLAKSGLAA